MHSANLPPVIAAKLKDFERRCKSVLALRGVAESIAVFCGGIVVLALVEAVFKPHYAWRVWLSGGLYLATGVCLAFRAALPLLRRRKLRQVAWEFELAAGNHFEERIVSAVELAESPPGDQPGVSSWMVARTIQLAGEEIGATDGRSIIDRAPAVVAWKRAGVCLVALGALCLIPGLAPRVRLVLNPSASTVALSKIQFSVAPGSCHIRQGAPLKISVSGNNLPDQVKVRLRWNDGFQEAVPMQRNGTNQFALSLPAVAQAFRYSVQAADAESETFSVKLDVPPRIARMQVLIEPPAYAGWTNRVVEGGSADFLAGSRLRLIVDAADEKVADAEWISDVPQLRRFAADNNRLTLELQPTNQVSYQVKLTGVNKLQSASAQKWVLRPVPDQPPSARLVAIGTAPGLVQRDEVLPLQVQAGDDVGLKRLDLIALSKDSEADQKVLYKLDSDAVAREFRTPLNYNLAELNTVTGDEVQLQLVATDLRDQTTRSEALSFTVGTPDKALEAQVAARLKQLVSALVAQLEFLQQTRSSWLAIARNYSENDPSGQGPSLTVLKSRLREFGQRVNNIGQRLVAESETNALPDARFMYRLGSTISSWGGQQSEVLLANCSRVESERGTNVYENFALGRELFSRVVLDLEQYRLVMAILVGALETDVLATRCESAQARYKRALPVLRGENTVAPLGHSGAGLLATFFEDAQLNGKVLEQKVAMPRLDNYAPSNRRENWSCRFEGELNIAAEGDWTLGCAADDGVRLLVAGNSLLPKESWSAHSVTEYKADLKLKAGWHPVIIEFFQGASESKLRFLASRKGQPLQEVPAHWLRPPPARQPRPDLAANTVLNALVQVALKERVKNSLGQPAVVPPLLAPLTNDVQNETLRRLVREKFPVGVALLASLAEFASWTPDQSREPETKADDLSAAASAARRILREELEKYRWRYEGAAALKEVQNAIEELRDITQELRRLPWSPSKTRSEEERAKVQLAKAWQKELQRATAEAAHQFFETAKEKEATLAQRATALAAAVKTEEQLLPSAEKLAEVLNQNRNKEEMAGGIEQQLNDVANRYRELNDLQEKINREEIAAQARQALPPSRAFARAQQAQDQPSTSSRYETMKPAVAGVVKALRVAGDYDEAQKLQARVGERAESAKGTEVAQQVRDLAMRTDNNIPSLAQSIPPPMRQQTRALEEHKATQQESANSLARPRLAMSLEGARLARQGDRKTAVAYGLLGEDLGSLLETPDKLASATVQPLTDRAAALAGEKGEEARQAEIRAANERLRQMMAGDPNSAEALASRLEGASALSRQAAGEAPKRQPLASELGEMSKLAPPVANWADATEPREIASGAAHESANEIQAAPNKWESYNAASEMLADAARQIRSDAASSELADLNPYPSPPSPSESEMPGTAPAPEANGNQEGMTGKAITLPPPKGLDQAEWARLAERLRQAIRSSGIENFSPEHQAAIRAYFERLSSDNQTPTR